MTHTKRKIIEDRVHLQLHGDEAEAVLAILSKVCEGQPIGAGDWQQLFGTEPYIRLKRRDAELGVGFTDSDFKHFVLSPPLKQKTIELRKVLDEWFSADLSHLAVRVLDYLPVEACLAAKIFPVIKPRNNSFVEGDTADAAIFICIDPHMTAAQFENTLAHELHHIGLGSVESHYRFNLKGMPSGARSAAEWIGAFREGEAVLAAAGSIDIHPHANSKPEDQARWEQAVDNFNRDLQAIEEFLLGTIDGRLAEDQVEEVGLSFFGVQGPWYTVGWKMAVVVEKHFGRPKLIECMQDPRLLLMRYNEAALEMNSNGEMDRLALWSGRLLSAFSLPGD